MQQHSTTRRQARIRAGITLSALMAVVLQAPIVNAQVEFDPGDFTGAPRQSLVGPARTLAGMSLDRIIAIVEKRHSARVVRHDEAVYKDRRVYILRLLYDDGRVKRVRVDAETGGEV